MRVAMQRRRIWQIALLNLILFACTVGPKYEQPFLEMPSEWHSNISEGMQSDDEPDCFQWWQSFNDPVLNSLIERAATQNLDLSIAGMRILEAREEEKGGKAFLYPHIDGSATYGHAQYNQKTVDRLLGIHRRGSRTKNVNFFEVGFDADWEIDLFGKNRHDFQALQARRESSEHEFMNIWISLSAEIAKNYIELRGLQQRLEVIKRHIAAQEDTLNLTHSLIYSGFTTSLDQKQAEGQLNQLIAQKPLLELSISKSIHRLSILLGHNPGELFAELCRPSHLPCLPYQKPIGFPSELLRRRPDILRAERDLAAATEQVGSAIAALFPRLSLQGFVGDIAALCSGSLTWFGGGQILQPIFNSKLLEQDVTINKIKTRQALYAYQKTVLEALEEAENAIASFRFESERNSSLAKAHKVSQEAHILMNQLYEKGLKDYLQVQAANRSLLESEDSYLQSQVDLLFHYIALYKALGGGWELD